MTPKLSVWDLRASNVNPTLSHLNRTTTGDQFLHFFSTLLYVASTTWNRLEIQAFSITNSGLSSGNDH
jgi:hypothetical protein